MSETGSTNRVVWVLGAGFSQALGGPLLPNLLSRASQGNLLARFPSRSLLHDHIAEIVRSLYHYGRNWPEGRLFPKHALNSQESVRLFQEDFGEILWRDAEEFLEYVDLAAEDAPNPHALRLRLIVEALGGGSLRQGDLPTRARHLVAAECSGFLENANPEREQWAPFRRWEQSLGASDTVISFNYDRVVELLCDAHNRLAQKHGLARGTLVTVIRPGHPDDMREARQAGCCPLLKLHGSVDWSLPRSLPPQVSIMDGAPTFAVDCPITQMAIATPGPMKGYIATMLGEVWTLACEALRNADAIVFVGYRFPETDAHAREQLLNAIRENNKGKRHHLLSMHVVLGHPGNDSTRLAALLRHVARATGRCDADNSGGERLFRITAHPLFAQDFFTVVNRDELFA